MFIHFFCLCPLGLATKLNFNISKEAYYVIVLDGRFLGSDIFYLLFPEKINKIEEACDEDTNKHVLLSFLISVTPN